MSAIQLAKHWALRFYHVDENPKSMDIALLIIRIMVCLCLFYHHGAEKVFDFGELLTHKRLDPVGIGIMPSVIIAGISDFLCCLMVLFGLFSRYAALFVLLVLNTVWWIMDNGIQRLFGLPLPGAEHAPVPQAAAQTAQHVVHVVHSMPNIMNLPMYILGFLVIFIAGPGRYSLDKIFEKTLAKKLS